MGKPTGFMEFARELPPRRSIDDRTRDWKEIYAEFPAQKVQTQTARCMDCGIPFCHNGCPVNNVIPHWNDLVYRNRWKEAIALLHSTNNFPEFTGRICPAPCEAACVLGINDDPVTIKVVEREIVDHAFKMGWIVPEPPLSRTGKRVAVIGSGPSGLAAAQQLNRAGHHVTVYEKNDRLGGLLRYGIPDFKLEKHLIDRRVEQLQAEGIVFSTRTHVGVNIGAEEMRRTYDAIVLCGGSEAPRDLIVPGRELKGIHYAMDFLPQQNRRVAGERIDPFVEILATGKRAVIIGGGDTGADCLGTCIRQRAKSIHQFEIMPLPPSQRSPMTPWPMWPLQLRTESSHEEGGVREWAVATTAFEGDAEGNVTALRAIRVGPPPRFEPVAGTEFSLHADLVLLAMGFAGPTKEGMLQKLGVAIDARGNVKADENYMTSVAGVFSAGDMRRGQSLVVWAISEGRKAAKGVDTFLMGSSDLP
ncbi:MAG TPA: glutamate synthase subunit beta [Bacteroidota bacterium]|nr:glutamate synthase subunit beta [Bacteroidota bacterium]